MGISTQIWKSEIEVWGSEQQMLIAAHSASVLLVEVYNTSPEKLAIDLIPPDPDTSLSAEWRRKISIGQKKAFQLKRAVCHDDS